MSKYEMSDNGRWVKPIAVNLKKAVQDKHWKLVGAILDSIAQDAAMKEEMQKTINYYNKHFTEQMKKKGLEK